MTVRSFGAISEVYFEKPFLCFKCLELEDFKEYKRNTAIRMQVENIFKIRYYNSEEQAFKFLELNKAHFETVEEQYVL